MKILAAIDEAVVAGVTRESASKEAGLDPRTIERWRGGKHDDERRGPRKQPKNKLSPRERAKVIATATSAQYRDLSPKQIVPILADKGTYIASESTFYRVLREQELLAHRGRAKASTHRAKNEHVATGPMQLCSWDITYLRTNVRGQFYFLYLILDVWSRKVVGWRVEDVECTDMASSMVEDVVTRERKHPLVLHADNGSPMKGATLKATLERLGILASYSRPRVSDDNPFSESLFRTLKYRPSYPRTPFATLDEARTWVASFVDWYNNEHLHSSIGFVTPADRHDGRDVSRLMRRKQIYLAAQRRRPERWSGPVRTWDAPRVVALNPKDENHAATKVAA